MNRANPPSDATNNAEMAEGGKTTWVEIAAPVAERLSLNASDCCFIKRKRNRFSNAERNRGEYTGESSRAEDAMRLAEQIGRWWSLGILTKAGFLRAGEHETFTADKSDYDATWNVLNRKENDLLSLYCYSRILFDSRIRELNGSHPTDSRE